MRSGRKRKIIDCGDGDTEGGNCRKFIVTADGLRALQGNGSTAKDDAEFIAHAPTDMSALLAEVDRLRAEKRALILQRLTDLGQEIDADEQDKADD